jgi:hypothetical protein
MRKEKGEKFEQMKSLAEPQESGECEPMQKYL